MKQIATILLIAKILLACICAYGVDYNLCDPAPVRSLAPTQASAPAFGYDASRPYTEWAADFAPLGYGEYGKVISRRYVDAPAPAPVQFASYQPAQTYSPPVQTYQPSYQPAYQPSYAQPAQQFSSAPAFSGFSFSGSRCGPGGCR